MPQIGVEQMPSTVLDAGKCRTLILVLKKLQGRRKEEDHCQESFRNIPPLMLIPNESQEWVLLLLCPWNPSSMHWLPADISNRKRGIVIKERKVVCWGKNEKKRWLNWQSKKWVFHVVSGLPTTSWLSYLSSTLPWWKFARAFIP